MEKARNDGKIGHIGFSFHDDAAAFIKIIDSYENWDFCQIQYNYMDITNQAGINGLLYAAKKGISVVIMEPLLGGRLARPPQSIAAMFKNPIGSRRTPAEWSLQWIWNYPEVSTVLSGMSTMEQVQENIAAAQKSQSDSLSTDELAFVEQIRNEFSKRTVIPCTKCNYCMPCPYGVIIPWNLELYNQGVIYGDPGSPRFVYNNFVKPENRASECIGCKSCESRCPQQIKISEWMPKIQAVLGQNENYEEQLIS
jgi:predicted aldo/keto reductase-like oxidoreductase